MSTASDEQFKKNFTAVMTYVFRQFDLGRSDDEIKSDLLSKGMGIEQAQTVVDTGRKMHAGYAKGHQESPVAASPTSALSPAVVDTAQRLAAAQRGWKRMWTGLIWFALGSLITWASYSGAASSPIGGSYTVCYGAIALGGLYFLWGLLEWLSNR